MAFVWASRILIECCTTRLLRDPLARAARGLRRHPRIEERGVPIEASTQRVQRIQTRKRAGAFVVVVVALVSLAACASAESDTASATPSTNSTAAATPVVTTLNDEYRATVASFPYELPPGFAFADTMPAIRHATVTPVDADGPTVAFGLWRCGLVEAAREASNAGDIESIRHFLEQAAQASDEELPDNAESVGLACTIDARGLQAEAALCEN